MKRVVLFCMIMVVQPIAQAQLVDLRRQLIDLKQKLTALHESLKMIRIIAAPQPTITTIQPIIPPPITVDPEIIELAKKIKDDPNLIDLINLTPAQRTVLKAFQDKSVEEIENILKVLESGQIPPVPTAATEPSIPPIPTATTEPPMPTDEIQGPPPPPPPPPPAPAFPTAPAIIGPKTFNITEQELRQLPDEAKQLSNDYVIDIFKKFARPQSISVEALQKNIMATFDNLKKEAAFKAGFRFSDNQQIEKVRKELQSFIETNVLKKENESVDQYIQRINQNLHEYAQRMFTSIKPLLIGAISDQMQNEWIDDFVNIIINFASTIRMNEPVPAIAALGAEAKQSDQEFINIITKAQSVNELVKELNLLRIKPNYLKYTSLIEDLGKQKEGTAGEGAKTAAQAQRDALFEAIRARSQQASTTSAPISAGFIALLTKRGFKAEQLTNINLQRYLYLPQRLDDSLRAHLDGLTEKVVAVPVGTRATKPISTIPSMDFADFIKEAIESEDFFQSVIPHLKNIIKKAPITFQNKRVRIGFSPENEQTALEIMKQLDKMASARKGFYERGVINLLKQQYGTIVGNQLPDDLRGKLDEILKSRTISKEIDDKIISEIRRIIESKGTIPWTLELLNSIDQLKQSAIYEYDKTRLDALADALIDLFRTPYSINNALASFISRLEDKDITRMQGSLSLLLTDEPYGWLLNLFNKHLTDDAKQIYNNLIVPIEEINEKGTPSSPINREHIPSTGIKSLIGKLQPLLNALYVQQTAQIPYILGTFVRQPGVKEISEKYQPFGEKIYQTLAKKTLSPIIEDMKKLNTQSPTLYPLIKNLTAEGPNFERDVAVYNQIIGIFDPIINWLQTVQNQSDIHITQQTVNALKKQINTIMATMDQKIRDAINNYQIKVNNVQEAEFLINAVNNYLLLVAEQIQKLVKE